VLLTGAFSLTFRRKYLSLSSALFKKLVNEFDTWCKCRQFMSAFTPYILSSLARIYSEDGSSKFLRIAGSHQINYTPSHLTKQQPQQPTHRYENLSFAQMFHNYVKLNIRQSRRFYKTQNKFNPSQSRVLIKPTVN